MSTFKILLLKEPGKLQKGDKLQFDSARIGAATFEWAESNHTIVVKNTSGQLLRVSGLSLPGAVANGGLL